MILQTIEYYRHNKSNSCLDCCKAFDKVKHRKLFNILKDKNVCLIIINMYELCNANVKWNGVMSDNFNVPNGVK